jgi:hypothetical protein
VTASLPHAVTHPTLPAVELWRCPRTGEHYLIAMSVRLTSADLVDLGEWLVEQGRGETPL